MRQHIVQISAWSSSASHQHDLTAEQHSRRSYFLAATEDRRNKQYSSNNKQNRVKTSQRAVEPPAAPEHTCLTPEKVTPYMLPPHRVAYILPPTGQTRSGRDRVHHPRRSNCDVALPHAGDDDRAGLVSEQGQPFFVRPQRDSVQLVQNVPHLDPGGLKNMVK